MSAEYTVDTVNTSQQRRKQLVQLWHITQFLSYPTNTVRLLTIHRKTIRWWHTILWSTVHPFQAVSKCSTLPTGSSKLSKNITYRNPIVEIRQIYLAIVVNKHWRFDLHIGCRFHVTHWGIVRMCIHQPDTYRDIVHTSCTKHSSWLGSLDKTCVLCKFHLTIRNEQLLS